MSDPVIDEIIKSMPGNEGPNGIFLAPPNLEELRLLARACFRYALEEFKKSVQGFSELPQAPPVIRSYAVDSAYREKLRRLAEGGCPNCANTGRRMYPNTNTWRRGGVSGQAFTEDVCDQCWGSGDESNPGKNLRLAGEGGE